jgi:hypothetical protein
VPSQEACQDRRARGRADPVDQAWIRGLRGGASWVTATPAVGSPLPVEALPQRRRTAPRIHAESGGPVRTIVRRPAKAGLFPQRSPSRTVGRAWLPSLALAQQHAAEFEPGAASSHPWSIQLHCVADRTSAAIRGGVFAPIQTLTDLFPGRRRRTESGLFVVRGRRAPAPTSTAELVECAASPKPCATPACAAAIAWPMAEDRSALADGVDFPAVPPWRCTCRPIHPAARAGGLHRGATAARAVPSCRGSASRRHALIRAEMPASSARGGDRPRVAGVALGLGRLDRARPRLGRGDLRSERKTAKPEDLATLIYTSGTT